MTCDTHQQPAPQGNVGRAAAAAEECKMGPHAKYTFAEIEQHGPPVDPLREGTPPIIFRAQRRPRVKIEMADGSTRDEYVYLMKDGPHAPRAYRRIPKSQKKTIEVKYGHVIFALQLDHVKDNVYQESSSMVAIKKLHKAPFALYLERGGHENPYNAISRMQTIGDDDHVLSCIEAMEDDKYLYTVMPFCEGRSLLDMIQDGSGLMEYETRSIYGKILENVHYLQAHSICHHDLSPDNILQLKGKLVFCDLAMSFTVPNGNARRQLMAPQSPYGKPPYWTPEVLVSRIPFDAYQLDVWATGCILYNLLTTMRLFLQPHPSDVLFRYFLMAGGLSNNPMNHRTVEVLIDTFHASENDRQALLERAMAHLRLSKDAVTLLRGVLQIHPRDRWTLAQIVESEWMTQALGPDQ
jgi:serine/threonine protein kinase